MYTEIAGDIWSHHHDNNWVVIPTNGFVKNNGEAVMGRGLALQASKRFPGLASHLGGILNKEGNRVYAWENQKLFTFPVKHNWWEKADIELIKRGMEELTKLQEPGEFPTLVIGKLYFPHVGCGNGQLDWKDVCPIVEPYLDDRYIVITQA